jgi:hypothetical protein
MPDPKCDTEQAFRMSLAAAFIVMALGWQFVTVMYPVALMNNEEIMIRDKEKQPCFTSSASCLRINYLAFAYDAGVLITAFIIWQYLMFSNPRNISQSVA